MVDDYYAGFRQFLAEGMRIELGIPLSGGGVFRDWAVIRQSHQDELLVQISRDVLPANVRIDVGFILDVCVWVRKEAYTCSGIVTEKRDGRVLRVRLFGSFTLRERRQFFRLALELRVRYALLTGGSRGDIEQDWEQRKLLEHMKFQGYDDFVISAQKARYQPALQLDWQELPLSEVNLGGGGMRAALRERLQPEQLVALEIHLPLPQPRVVHAVAQGVYVLSAREETDGRLSFGSGLQFLLLDERDRDLVFQHISALQIAQLKILADRREFPEPAWPAPVELGWRQFVRRSLWGLLLLILFFYVIRSLVHYQEAGPPNQIQKTYEKSIKQYRHAE